MILWLSGTIFVTQLKLWLLVEGKENAENACYILRRIAFAPVLNHWFKVDFLSIVICFNYSKKKYFSKKIVCYGFNSKGFMYWC